MAMSPPRSFGRPDPAPEQPPMMMPMINLPVVLVIDADSLAGAAQQIQQMVAQAVRDGFDEALAERDPDDDDPGRRRPDLPDVDPAQLDRG